MFNSFIFAGFECATGYNKHRRWMDQICATQHDIFVDEDYQRLNQLGIRAAREAVRWPLVDLNGRFEFTSLTPFLNASKRQNIQLVFDLFHFGYPEDVDLFSEAFADRFAKYCRAAAQFICSELDGPYFFTPINEPSYFAWAAGEAGLFAPHIVGRSWELKVSLIRAAIAAIEAIWSVCPNARIINADSLCRVVSPENRPDLDPLVADYNSRIVFQSWDMLSGAILPELGGSPKHLDVVGVNYYWTNQWEYTNTGVPLADGDPRKKSLGELIATVSERYDREIVISETSHIDEMRPAWLRELTKESIKMFEAGIPLRGICLYPILGMPEWHDPGKWTRMGIWDLVRNGNELQRVLYEPLRDALEEAKVLDTF